MFKELTLTLVLGLKHLNINCSWTQPWKHNVALEKRLVTIILYKKRLK